MKKILVFVIFCLINSLIFSQNYKIEFKISSSETGYSLKNCDIRVTDTDNAGKLISVNHNKNNLYFTNLPEGTYMVRVSKSGFTSCETYFSIIDKDIRYAIFLDPVIKSPLLKPERIKNLVNDNTTMLLGYVVDDETGEAVGSAELKDLKSNFSATTDGNGYFEFYIPSSCDTRTTAKLVINSPGYKTEEYRNFEIYPKTDFIFTIRLKKFSVQEMKPDLPLANSKSNGCEGCTKILTPVYSGFVLPQNIRVGRNCTGTTCTYAEVYSLETYCKYVLPAEIYACWGNLSGGMNSLKACAVAVRTYGIYHVYNPINSSLYDICDNTYCQYMGSVTSTNTNNAVDETFRYMITNSTGAVRCEYSAENNNKGCGNGYSGTGSSWPCIYDPVCLNKTPNGHGRGLCQWGTIRWATGTFVSTSSPCSMGTPHSYGTLSWQQILNHYYNVSPYNWTVTLGTTAVINSSAIIPPQSNPCSTITINSNINAANTVSLMIGASIAPAGTTNWISDPAHDIKIIFPQGTGNYSRSFTIPCNIQPGYYDLLTALWYDKDNNNQINAGDIVVNSKLTQNALRIFPVGIQNVSSRKPDKFNLRQNYPNPFNPETFIEFDIQKTSFVTISVFDISGREMKSIVKETLQPGIYKTDFNGSGFPSGIYFYTIRAGSFSMTKKMMLVK